MGWTSYNATHYKNGAIDRKAECDSLMNDSKGYFCVVKSALVGSTYYAAVKRMRRCGANDETVPLPEAEQLTFAVVIKTATNMRDYFNFSYKDMSEDMHPYYYDCPKSILSLLSPTNDENALAWREGCRRKAESKKGGLGKLPIGAVIELKDGTRLIKHKPAYQFRTPFWYCEKTNKYMPKKYIGEYTVIAV